MQIGFMYYPAGEKKNEWLLDYGGVCKIKELLVDWKSVAYTEKRKKELLEKF